MMRTKLLSREISWKVLDIEIFGTITYPDDNLSHPGIVTIAGSGPTDRDWCSPLLSGKNGSGKLLAEPWLVRAMLHLDMIRWPQDHM